MFNEEKLNKLLRIVSIFAISCCCVLLFPQMRKFVLEIGEKILGRSFNNPNKWIKLIIDFSVGSFIFFIIILLTTIKKIQSFLEKYKKSREIFFILISIISVITSITVRIIMYVKCRSLYIDEAFLAESIVARNWFELLIPPLDNMQSAPILYVIFVKLIASIFRYSEFSLRLISLFSFFGLLICVIILLKRAFHFNNYQFAFVVAMTALLPAYIRYSNELKPYMGDAFFVVLTILLYYYYTQNKLKLLTLTISYVLILGFSSPAIFFVGGILFFEFLAAIYSKNKKQLINVFIASTVTLLLFVLYYLWWMLPVLEDMKTYWDNYDSQYNVIMRIIYLFIQDRDVTSLFLIIFIPFALFGFYSLSRTKNKISCSVVLSLFFAFLASAIGFWPLTGRLWLFLPSIILIYVPVGIDYIHNKINCEKITKAIEYFIFTITIIFFSINCLGYIGDKMYINTNEINPLIDYVQKNINNNEKIYVYPTAKYAFEYKNGYALLRIGNVDNDNIIFGNSRSEWGEYSLGNDLSSILENKYIYLLFYDYKFGKGIDNGLDFLKNYGTLTEVMNVYDTLLYYFERNFSNE